MGGGEGPTAEAVTAITADGHSPWALGSLGMTQSSENRLAEVALAILLSPNAELSGEKEECDHVAPVAHVFGAPTRTALPRIQDCLRECRARRAKTWPEAQPSSKSQDLWRHVIRIDGARQGARVAPTQRQGLIEGMRNEG